MEQQTHFDCIFTAAKEECLSNVERPECFPRTWCDCMTDPDELKQGRKLTQEIDQPQSAITGGSYCVVVAK